MIKYYVAQCPKCGTIQNNRSENLFEAVFKCRRCGKYETVYGAKGQNIKIYLISSDGRKTKSKVIELTEMERIKHEQEDYNRLQERTE